MEDPFFMDGLTIGQVAKKVGLNPRTIRYYERIGLIAPPRRREGQSGLSKGYRLFEKADIGRLRFVKKARSLNFSLQEIRQLNQLVGNGAQLTPALTRLLSVKLKEAHEKAHFFQEIARHLKRLQKRSLKLPSYPQCCDPLCGPEICP